MMDIIVKDGEMSPYCDAIRAIFTRELPKANINTQDKVDALTEVFLGSGQTRFGPIPSPEVLVSIREVLTHYVNRGEPIKMLIPMGPKKNVLFKGIDIAEFSVLSSLRNLNAKVSEAYAPGAFFRFRVEDATGMYLEKEENKDHLVETIEVYTGGFDKLRRILIPKCSDLYRESENMEMARYHSLADGYAPYIEAYLKESDLKGLENYKEMASFKTLSYDLGWKGEIPMEQRGYYYHLYSNRWPNMPHSFYQKKLAEYFAITLSRVVSHGIGYKTGEQYISLNYLQPIPGNPSGYRRLYYRTLPLNQSKKHVPYWRTKGIVKIGDKPSFSLTQDWNDPELHMGKTIISSEGITVELDSDYIIL